MAGRCVSDRKARSAAGPSLPWLAGADATVTDAFLHLGYLNPDFFLGGRMTILPQRAEQAIHDSVAEKLNVARRGCVQHFPNHQQQPSNGIRYVSVAQGHDFATSR
jgi:N-methylhydantoinase A/oxoprolinase/acetone carboxylase beta subunit